MVLLNVSAAYGRFRGMLLALMEWWNVSLTTWPDAEFVGKADDDVWANLPGIATNLRLAHDAIGHSWWIILGAMEVFHWDAESHRPVGWHDVRQLSVMPNCTRNADITWRAMPPIQRKKHDAIVGPFVFPRGPLFFLSAPLAAAVLSNDWVRREAERTRDSIPDDESAVLQACEANASLCGTMGTSSRPWEDVFLGVALAKAMPQARPRSDPKSGVAAVHLGCPLFHTGWGFFVARSTLVWHDAYSGGLKRPERIGAAQRFSDARSCVSSIDTRSQHLVCTAANTSWNSCSGLPWTVCEWRRDNQTGTCAHSALESLQDGGFRHVTCSPRPGQAGRYFGARWTANKTAETQPGATCKGCQLLY